MNIVFLINSTFPNYSGGRETWLKNVSNRLVKKYNVYIVAEKSNNKKKPFHKLSKDIKLINYSTFKSNKVTSKIIRNILVDMNSFYGSIKMFKQLKKIIDSKPDEEFIVICMDTIYTGISGIRTKKIKKNSDKVNVICSVRSKHAEILGEKRKILKCIYSYIENEVLKRSDAVWANGYDTQKYLYEKGINSIVMKNGTDVKGMLKQSEESLVFPEEISSKNIKVISVATLSDIKGPNELITATHLLKKNYNIVIDLIFVGKGHCHKYKRLAENLGVENNVYFLGEKSNVAKYMKNSNIVACLSGGSGMSMSAIEAMLMKKPIIAWNSDIYKQFNRNHETMVLVNEKDVMDLAEKLFDIINEPEQYYSIINNAFQEGQGYDWNEICSSFEREIMKVNKNIKVGN